MEMQLHQLKQPYNPLFLNKSNELIEDAQIVGEVPKSSSNKFIEANTIEVTLPHLKNDCIIPVFSKDNEVTISHNSFIEAVWESANKLFKGENITFPDIRVSHMIKGRTPEAIHKSVKELIDIDKTIYYERMMFCMEIPSIYEDINGNRLNLSIGGVRAYNQENLYSKKTVEKFKVFIGFKNLVCCNLCVSTDGLCEDLRVTNTADLIASVMELFLSYNAKKHLELMRSMLNYSLTESQIAQLIGKLRLYQHLPQYRKKLLPEMLMTDTQINLMAKAYYHDENFSCTDVSENISLWSLYNLFTGANKSSYIDNFLERSHNASQLIEGINKAIMRQGEHQWFIE